MKEATKDPNALSITVPADRDSSHLVIQTAFIGDVLLTIPLLKHLRRLLPNQKLVMLCRKGMGDYLLRSGLIDEAIEVDKSQRQSWRVVRRSLRSRRFGWLISPHQSPRSKWLAMIVRARRKIGYEGLFSRWAYDETFKRPLHLPEALRQLILLEALEPGWADRLRSAASADTPESQWKDGEVNAPKLPPVPEWAEMSVDPLVAIRRAYQTDRVVDLLSEPAKKVVDRLRLAAGTRRFLFLAPGSVWPTKMWTPQGFAALASGFTEQGWQIVFMGAPNERDVVEAISRQVPGAMSIAGETTLFESAEVLASSAEVLVCNDSGAMHMAATAQVPTVTLFGPTVLSFGYRPWQDRATVLEIAKEFLPCRPCGKHGAKVCPIGTHACMRRIEAPQVARQIQLLLNKPES